MSLTDRFVTVNGVEINPKTNWNEEDKRLADYHFEGGAEFRVVV